MTTGDTLLHAARDLLEAECVRRTSDQLGEPAQDDSGALRGTYRPIQPQMLDGVLPELVQLIAEAHDQPASAVEATIRNSLLEHSFVDEGGGGYWFDGEVQSRIDELVDLMTHLLEQVRQQAISDGRWSDAPVTPQMFG